MYRTPLALSSLPENPSTSARSVRNLNGNTVPDRPPLLLRLRAWLPFVASAALVALGIQMALQTPWLGLLMIAASLLVFIPRLRARQRLHKMVQSGNADELIDAWESAVTDLPHADTMLPLIQATALASNGLIDRARTALARAARGSAWEAALEHRLIVETLLDTFEGERELALEKAARLSALPLPPVGPVMQGRVTQLRAAIGAVARAFAHEHTAEDGKLLQRAASKNPLVHWPLRYAAAVVCVDAGSLQEARRLISDAPEWPEGSAFRAFHAELLEHSEAPGSA